MVQKCFGWIGVDMEDVTDHQTGDGCSRDGLAELVKSMELEGLGLLLSPGDWSLNLCSLNSVLSFRPCLIPFSPLSLCQCFIFPPRLIRGVEPTH